MKVIVGSKNRDKINIVLKALSELHLDINVDGVGVDSEISNQPLDKEATKNGAINRARNAKKTVPEAEFWIGLEGGLHDYGEGYHLVTFACLIDTNGNEFVGTGKEIQLPEEVSYKVKNGEWFGDVIRDYAKDHEVDENLITRLSPFTQAAQGSYVEYLKAKGALGYRSKVSGIITDDDGNFLIVQLVDYSDGHWNWCGGGMENGEEVKDTILRELNEELGTDKFEIQKTSTIVNTYDWPNYVIAKRLAAEGRTWKGQNVAHVHLKFVGSKTAIIPEPREIKQLKWVSLNDLESHFVIPNQWNVARQVIKEFGL